MNQPKESMEWAVEFDRQFAVYHFTSDGQKERVRKFISSLLLSERQKLVKKVEGVLEKYKNAYHYDKDFLREIARIEPEILEILKKEI